jgi:hypothetical protein
MLNEFMQIFCFVTNEWDVQMQVSFLCITAAEKLSQLLVDEHVFYVKFSYGKF